MSEQTNAPLPTEDELKSQVEKVLERLGVSEGTIAPDIEEQPDAIEQMAAAAGESDVPPVNWDDYELDPNLAHLYRKATIEQTLTGPQIVAPWFQLRYETVSKKKVAMIEEAVNGPEQWQIAALLPASYGEFGVVMQRMVRRALPIPNKIVTETTTPAPTDEELAAAEAAALAWAGTGSALEQAVEDAATNGGTDAVA